MLAGLLKRVDQLENWVRMALSRAGSGDTLASQLEYPFVFRPGASSPLPPGVFATQAALRTAMLAVATPKLLEIDGSGGGPTTFSGVVDFLDNTTITSRAGETLTFAAGATITNTKKLSLSDNVFLQNTGTVVWTISGTAFLIQSNLGSFAGSAGGAFIDIPGGAVLGIELTGGSGVGDSVNVAIAGAGALGMTNIDGVVTAHAVGAGLAWSYNNDATAELQQPQGSTPTFTYFAGPNELQELDAAGHGAAGTITSNSAGTIRQLYSGKVSLHMQVTFTQGGGAPGNSVLTLQRDGANIVGAPTAEATVASGSLATLSLDWTDTLPDALAHHYGWTMTTSAGTVAVAGGQASIRATEEK